MTLPLLGFARLGLPLLFLACAPEPIKTDPDTDGSTDGDADTDADADTDTDADCTATVVGIEPADGDIDVASNTTVVATFSTPVDAAEIGLDGGMTGSVTIADNGLSAVFTPDGFFAAGQTYTATAAVCESSDAASFTILEAPDEAVLEGKTYAIDLTQANFEDPPGIGGILGDQLTTPILLGVVAVTGVSLETIGAIGVAEADPAEQEFCAETLDFPDADYSGAPGFQIGPADLALNVAGYDITIDDLLVSGIFADDGSEFHDGVFEGYIDTRPLVPLYDPTADEDAICVLVGYLGASCVACSSDGGEFCLHMLANEITAYEVEDLTLAPVAGADCDGCDAWTPDTVPDAADQVCVD